MEEVLNNAVSKSKGKSPSNLMDWKYSSKAYLLIHCIHRDCLCTKGIRNSNFSEKVDWGAYSAQSKSQFLGFS